MPSYSAIKKRIQLYHKIRSFQDKAPLIVLIVAGVIGTITGIVGVLFQYAVNWVISLRKTLLFDLIDNEIINYLLIFAITGTMGGLAY